MLLTSAELMDNPQLAGEIKSWAGDINRAIKASDAPTFELSGPCTLKVRMRQTGTPAQSYSFMGEERFRIANLIIDRSAYNETMTISVMMTPCAASLARDIVAVTLPLAEAISIFDGLESWVGTIRPLPEAEAAPLPAVTKLPTVEETRAATTWGAW